MKIASFQPVAPYHLWHHPIRAVCIITQRYWLLFVSSVAKAVKCCNTMHYIIYSNSLWCLLRRLRPINRVCWYLSALHLFTCSVGLLFSHEKHTVACLLSIQITLNMYYGELNVRACHFVASLHPASFPKGPDNITRWYMYAI